MHQRGKGWPESPSSAIIFSSSGFHLQQWNTQTPKLHPEQCLNQLHLAQVVQRLTHTHIHTHSLLHSLTHSHTHSLTHSRTHTRAHTHTHTHIHTHTLTPSLTQSITHTGECITPWDPPTILRVALLIQRPVQRLLAHNNKEMKGNKAHQREEKQRPADKEDGLPKQRQADPSVHRIPGVSEHASVA